MPGFGDNPNTVETEGDGMLAEMIAAIARYESSLPRPRRSPPDAPSVELTTAVEDGGS